MSVRVCFPIIKGPLGVIMLLLVLDLQQCCSSGLLFEMSYCKDDWCSLLLDCSVDKLRVWCHI